MASNALDKSIKTTIKYASLGCGLVFREVIVEYKGVCIIIYSSFSVFSLTALCI